MTIIIIVYTRIFKYIEAIFLDKEKNIYRKVATPSTSNFGSLPYPYPKVGW